MKHSQYLWTQRVLKDKFIFQVSSREQNKPNDRLFLLWWTLYLRLYSKTAPWDDHSAATSTSISTRWCCRSLKISERYVLQFDTPTWVDLAAIKIDSYWACWSSPYVFIWYSAYLHPRILCFEYFFVTQEI